MFAQKTRLLVVAASLLLSVNAHAGFVETDWQTVGDKKATLHQETGLEWLDLTVTGGKTINEVKAMLGTTLLGWRMPTYDEIKQMAAYAFPNMRTADSHYGAIYGSKSAEFKMLGANYPYHYYGSFELNSKTYGLGFYSYSSEELYFGYDLSTAGGSSYRGGTSYLDLHRVYEGVFLVSDGGATLSSINDPSINANNPNAPINAVSTPAVGVLSAMLIAFGMRRRRTK